jgi:hypothetical protein
MAEPQSPPPSEAERLDAAIAALLAERRRRSGWPKVEVQIVDGGRLSARANEALAPQQHEFPPELIVLEVMDPDPVVELPGTMYAPDHGQAVDVTPSPPWRPPVQPPSPPKAAPRTYSNSGIPAEIHAKVLRQLANFESDVYDPADAPLRYPRGRSGW